MEVVSHRASQLTQHIYASSVVSLLAVQLHQQQLIAFCTLLTVALSVFYISRHRPRLLASSSLTRCLRCLCHTPAPILRRLSHFGHFGYHFRRLPRPAVVPLKYLKLKRLRSITSSSSSYYSYCTRYLNKMRRETKIRVKNIINIKSGMAWRYSAANSSSLPSFLSQSSSSSSSSTQSIYCPACDLEKNNINNITTSHSYPILRDKSSSNLSTSSSIRRNFTEPRINSSKIHLYRKLPLRSMSRAWGEINSIELPTYLRKPCFYFYSWMFSCNLDEIDIDDLTQYKNLSEFFRRGLKPDARVIHPAPMVSPCDGKILHFGQVDKGMLEQVKGVNYSLEAFLGEQNWPKNVSRQDMGSRPPSPTYTISSSLSSEDEELNRSVEVAEQYERSILYHPDENCLFHCVIYLAPGDYHRFHSPVDWEVFARRHFPGELFSVNPSVARWLQGLFNFNERVVYYGEWEHGFFSMTAVGATNVGSIRVYMDNCLTTNTKLKSLDAADLDKNFSTYDCETGRVKGVEVKKGENFGEFNLGSTVVLIFEAPKDFKFAVNQNDKVFYGCHLGSAASSVEQTKL